MKTASHHRRGLKDDEDLLQRDFEAEELGGFSPPPHPPVAHLSARNGA